MKDRKECDHKNTRKMGFRLSPGKKHQMRQCKDCGYTFKAELIG